MFDNGADTILTKLSGAAEAVGKVLHLHFFELAKKVFLNINYMLQFSMCPFPRLKQTSLFCGNILKMTLYKLLSGERQ